MKKFILNMTIILIMILFPTTVYGANITSELILDDEDITTNESLNATIRLNAVTRDEMYVFTTRIDYDESTFTIDEGSFKAHNGWSDIEYNPKTHTLVTLNKYGTVLNEDIISFDIKLNKGARPGTNTIGLKDAIISNANKDFYLTDTTDNLKVNLSANQMGNNYNTKKNMGAELSTGSVKLYYILTLIVLELVVAIILVLIYYAATNRITKKSQKVKLAAVLLLIEVASISAFFGFDVQKGDLNSDNLINSKDVDILVKHLTNTEILSNFKLEKADLNSDGKITPSDIAILVNKSYAKTTYIAKLSDSLMEENGYEKGNEIELKFLADVTDDEKIEYVLLQGKKYKVKRNKNNEYSIKLKASDVSKTYDYSITEVILANGRSAKVDYETSITVLKDIPTLTNYVAKEDIEHSKMDVAFTLNDPDDAITTATYELVDSNGRIIKTGNLTRGKNSLELALANAVPHKLNIKVYYNRGTSSGAYTGSIEDSYDLKLITDYRFQISNLNLVQNNVATKNIEKNTKTLLTFTSYNISGYGPKKIRINNREYTVYSSGRNTYKVSIPNSLLTGTPLNITRVTLSNGKAIVTKNTVSYNILKNKPTITGIKTFENTNESTITVGIDYKDNDKALTSLKVALYDKDGNLISEKITNGEEVILPTKLTSSYIIKIFGDYDRLYGVKGQNELLYEQNINAEMKATIVSAKQSEIYPDKNSTVFLDYEITSNYEANVKNIIINNIIYDVSKIGETTYRTSIDVGETSGVKTYKVDKLIFTNGLEYNTTNELKLDVLKDKPIMENFEVEEDLKNEEITATFDIFDTDSSFNKGSIKLIDIETEEVTSEKEIIPGKNTVLFKLINAKKYKISIDIDATLDTKELNPTSPNVLKDYNLFETEYILVSDYKFNITSIETKSDSETTEYFTKDEPINVLFTSTNATDYYPIKVKVNGVMYDIDKKDEAFNFTVPGFKESGVQTLKFESVILSNHAELNITGTKKIEILKSLPEVDIDVETTDTNIKMNIQLNDSDECLTNNPVVTIKDSNDSVIYTGIPKLVEFEKTTDEYEISIKGNYDLDTNELEPNKNEFQDQEFYKSTINLKEMYPSKETLKNLSFKLPNTVEPLTEIPPEELPNTEITIGEEEELETLKVLKYEIIEDKILIYLNKETWFNYNGKIYNKIILEYPLKDGLIILNNETTN